MMSTHEIPFPYGKGRPIKGYFQNTSLRLYFTFSSSSILPMRVPKKLIYMIYDK